MGVVGRQRDREKRRKGREGEEKGKIERDKREGKKAQLHSVLNVTPLNQIIFLISTQETFVEHSSVCIGNSYFKLTPKLGFV